MEIKKKLFPTSNFPISPSLPLSLISAVFEKGKEKENGGGAGSETAVFLYLLSEELKEKRETFALRKKGREIVIKKLFIL